MKKLSFAVFIFILLGAVILPSYNAVTGHVQSAAAFSSGGGGEGGCGGCGGDSDSSGGGGGSYTPNPPVCTISASLDLAIDGESFVVTWSASPASADFWINGAKQSGTGGSAPFDYDAQYDQISFTIYGENQDGTCGDEAIVYLKVPGCLDPTATNYNADANYDNDSCEYPAPTPVCNSFSINQSTVAPGANLTFNWNTTNVSNASINQGINSVLVDGTNQTYSAPTTPGTYTYILTFDGETSNSCRDTVTVEASTPVCEDPAANNTGGALPCEYPAPTPVCNSFSIAQSTVAPGANLTFNWNTTNVSNASINQGINSVPVDGSNQTYSAPITPGTYTYILTFDGETSNSCRDTVTVEEPTADTPKCLDFTATPSTIVAGESVTLNWEVENATTLGLNNGIGNVTGQTSFGPVAPSADTVYILDVFGAGGTKVQCEAPVTVTDPTAPDITIIKRDASDGDDIQTVDINGTANFEIAVTNTGNEDLENVVVTDPIETNCEKTIGALAAGDTNTYTCSTTGVTANFTNTAFVTGDSVVDGETVTDEDPTEVTVPADQEPAVCQEFAATPSNLPVGGGDVVLNWTVLNATSVVIDNGVGTVGLAGTSDPVSVTESTTFILTAVGEDGEDVTCPAPVAVADPGVFSCAANVSFTASDTSIDRGDSSQLTWNVTDADSVSISEINATSFTGTESVSPASDTQYILTATKAGFDPINCGVTIDVSTGGGGGGSSSPRCELDISATKIDGGDEVTLTWDSSRARELILSDDEGNVLVTTEDKLSDDKEEFFDGEITLTPTRNTQYTLVVERGSRDRECTVDVEVEEDEVVLLQTRDQAPLVTGISLTEVPYTGFEAGTVMTFMFYALLIAWALYITYILVIPKTSLATASAGIISEDPVETMARAESTRPDVFAPLPTKSVAATAAPTAPAPANLPVAPMPTMAAPVAHVDDTYQQTDVATEIENHAHLHQTLLSSGAVQSLIEMTTETDRFETLASVIADAKSSYPLEDGWVVINQTRLAELTATVAASTTTSVTGNGSLAEAIVTGNVVAAYELIGDRPMLALADAAADLDTLYRNRKGAKEVVSDLLTTASETLSDSQIADMISALTGAIDGTYTDEASAVKMAIMKAVKIAS